MYYPRVIESLNDEINNNEIKNKRTNYVEDCTLFLFFASSLLLSILTVSQTSSADWIAFFEKVTTVIKSQDIELILIISIIILVLPIIIFTINTAKKIRNKIDSAFEKLQMQNEEKDNLIEELKQKNSVYEKQIQIYEKLRYRQYKK